MLNKIFEFDLVNVVLYEQERDALSLPVQREVQGTSQWYTQPLSTITSTPEKENNTSISSLASASNSSLSGPKTPDPRVLTEEVCVKCVPYYILNIDSHSFRYS